MSTKIIAYQFLVPILICIALLGALNYYFVLNPTRRNINENTFSNPFLSELDQEFAQKTNDHSMVLMVTAQGLTSMTVFETMLPVITKHRLHSVFLNTLDVKKQELSSTIPMVIFVEIQFLYENNAFFEGIFDDSISSIPYNEQLQGYFNNAIFIIINNNNSIELTKRMNHRIVSVFNFVPTKSYQ